MAQATSEPFVETDCTISHHGQTFTANGCFISDSHITCYAKASEGCQPTQHWTPRYGWTFTDWRGNQIGTGEVTGTWRVGPYRTQMHSFIVRLPDGRHYNCRGRGEGMIATGRRAAAK